MPQNFFLETKPSLPIFLLMSSSLFPLACVENKHKVVPSKHAVPHLFDFTHRNQAAVFSLEVAKICGFRVLALTNYQVGLEWRSQVHYKSMREGIGAVV